MSLQIFLKYCMKKKESSRIDKCLNKPPPSPVPKHFWEVITSFCILRISLLIFIKSGNFKKLNCRILKTDKSKIERTCIAGGNSNEYLRGEVIFTQHTDEALLPLSLYLTWQWKCITHTHDCLATVPDVSEYPLQNQELK